MSASLLALHLVTHLTLEEIPAQRYPHDEGSTGQLHSVKPTLDACPEVFQVRVVLALGRGGCSL